VDRDVKDTIAPMAEALAAREGFELVDVVYRSEGGRWILRFYLDREEGGITIDDCQRFSRMLSVQLDTENPISHRYFLEVSSPGIERPLKKEKDYVRFRGKGASICLREPLEGRSRLIGKILDFSGGVLEFEEETLGTVRVPYADISSAKLRFPGQASPRPGRKTG
jgi:ribosome maturation factor RimP